MTTVTLTIEDTADDSISMTGQLDNPDAINQPPTPALIIGSYLAANAEGVCKDAMKWFETKIAEEQ